MCIRDSILETIGETPIVKINRLAPEGVTMYAKAEFFNPCSSVKDRYARRERPRRDRARNTTPRDATRAPSSPSRNC